MKQSLLLSILLVIFWLALSGVYIVFTLVLGALSVLLVMWLNSRMQITDSKVLPIGLLIRLPRYWAWLLVEIIKSNIIVARKIWQPSLNIQPQFKKVPSDWDKTMTRVIHANSITLTPGTVTVRVDDKELLVHGLTDETIQGLDSDEMKKQLEALDKA